MTHRDRAGDPSGQRAGSGEAAGDAGHPPSAAAAPLLRRTDRQGLPTAQCFWTGRRACDALHRRALRSWPKASGSRLYGSLSTLLWYYTNLLPVPQAWKLFAAPYKRRKANIVRMTFRPVRNIFSGNRLRTSLPTNVPTKPKTNNPMRSGTYGPKENPR